jgi:uncharacterized membrane protein
MLIAILIILVSMLLWNYNCYYAAMIVLLYGGFYAKIILKVNPMMWGLMFLLFLLSFMCADKFKEMDKEEEDRRKNGYQ